jgi:two-component system, OmpR family, response regulator
MLPSTLALIDDDPAYADFLARHLREKGVEVTVFDDSNDLLASPGAYEHGFYVLDLGLPGVDGLEVLKILRKRTQAGVLVVTARVGEEVLKDVLTAGADMHLTKPVPFDQVVLAVDGRLSFPPPPPRAGNQAPGAVWRLDRASSELQAPDGARIALSENDLLVMACLADARGETVTREQLRKRLGREHVPEAEDGLNAIIYRLRRRIERATTAAVPLQSRSRVGYFFKAPLEG